MVLTNIPYFLKSLDAETLKAELIAYIKATSDFSDVSFEGSNVNFIVNNLAYLTNYLSYIGQSSFNESFVDTIKLRRNMMSKAKELAYPVSRVAAAQGNITLSITDFTPVLAIDPTFNSLTDTLVLPAHSVVVGSDNYTFVTLTDQTLSFSNTFSATFNIYEGNWQSVTAFGTSDGTANQTFRLDDEALSDYFDLTVDGVAWTHEQDITEWESTSKYYQVFENYLETYDFEFGDDSIGAIPAANAVIALGYLQSNGSAANGSTNFSLSGSLYINGDSLKEVDNTAFTTTTNSKAVGGQDKEDIDSVRKLAPRYYAAQGRAINIEDYRTILSQHSLVEYANVYGGEEVNPPKYGYILATIKPPGADELTSAQEDEIIGYMEPYHIAGIRFQINPPFYLNIIVNNTQLFDVKHYTAANIIALSKAAVNTYFNTIFTNGEDYRYSDLIDELNDITGVVSSHLTVTTYIAMTTAPSGNYYWDTGQSITPGSVDLTFDTTKGIYDDSSGNLLDREDDSTIGEIDYTNGTIKITSYTKITSSQKFYIEFVDPDVELYEKMLVKYSASDSTFTTREVRNVT